MASSKYVWCVMYNDYTIELIAAQNVYQIMNCGELKQDIDNIIQIIRLELYSTWDEEIINIDIPYQD